MTDIAEMLKDVEDERNRYKHNEKAYYFIKKKQLAAIYDARHEVVQEYQFYADYTAGLLSPNFPVPAIPTEVVSEIDYVTGHCYALSVVEYNMPDGPFKTTGWLNEQPEKEHEPTCRCEVCRFWS